MNSYRKDFSNIPPSHTIKDSPNYIPINGHFINGFIAGDGSLYLRTKVNFGSMGIQISQHVNNKPRPPPHSLQMPVEMGGGL